MLDDVDVFEKSHTFSPTIGIWYFRTREEAERQVRQINPFFTEARILQEGPQWRVVIRERHV